MLQLLFSLEVWLKCDPTGEKKELRSAGNGVSEFGTLCSSLARTFQHHDSVGQLAHHCWSLPATVFSWDAGSQCLLEQPYSHLCSLCFPQFPLWYLAIPKGQRSKYALTAHVTLPFSSETLLSSTGLDYDLKLAASYWWLSIHGWNPCSNEDDAHQQYSTAASLFWINKTSSSFLNSVIFSVWSLSHLYLMEEAAL